MELHRVFGLAVPGFTLLTLAPQRAAYRRESIRLWTRAYRVMLVSTLGLLVVAGHLGGNLTHGSRYLTANAPEFVRDLLDPEPADLEPAGNGPPQDEQQRFYTDKVQPLLEARCYKCHGPDKQKGGYRLDEPELALQAGDSGKPAIKPGDPIGSYLVQLILLPPQHDDVMPPEGKEPLAPEEIMVLLDWIRNGAVFPRGEAGPAAAGQPPSPAPRPLTAGGAAANDE